MEKRAILAIGLSVLILIAFQYFQQKRTGRRAEPSSVTQVQPHASKEPKKENALNGPEREAAPRVVSTADTVASEKRVVIECGLYRAVVDNRGAFLSSWELKKYKSRENIPFEMIAGNRDESEPSLPGSLLFQDSKVTKLVNNEYYSVSVEGQSESDSALVPPATVVLTLKRGDLSIEKRFSFEKDNYLLDLSINCIKGGKEIEGKYLLGQDIGPEYEHLASSAKLQAVYYFDGKVRRETPPKDEKEIKKIGGDIRWAGLEMQYFAMIAIPKTAFPFFEIQKRPIKTVGFDGKESSRDLLRITTPLNGLLQYQIYIGPKKQSDLQAVRSADITGVINYGMFKILVYPLLASLRWIYQYVHNYGYAIITLTFLLSLLLFPFRLKQMISMKKMQVVQPKVKAIQEKYRRYKKTDPKRAEMNQEIMALYKQHNVNPLGGCLPLILQMPLLFAFYALLNYSIELRQAPFIWWIQDLSAKDPYYVLPIVMGITSFVLQKMTPMTPGADPTQAKVMMLMPAIFTVMFINLSSGLNLYFLCSNIFQVAFQKIAERWMSDGSARVPSKT